MESDMVVVVPSKELLDATVLRALVDLRDGVFQPARIAMGLRRGAVERGSDQMGVAQLEIIKRWEERFSGLEHEVENQIREITQDIPIIQEMVAVKGMGLMLAAKVVSMVDINRSGSVSALWKLSGYGMGKYWVNSKGELMAPIRGYQWKKVKGADGEERKARVLVVPDPDPDWHLETSRDINIKDWCSAYNARLKTSCYLVATSFMRCGSPYRAVYDSAKEYYEHVHPEWTKSHRHSACIRKMIKVWLSHVWLVWRDMEHLPTSAPYVISKLGHQHYYGPEQFGWKYKVSSPSSVVSSPVSDSGAIDLKDIEAFLQDGDDFEPEDDFVG